MVSNIVVRLRIVKEKNKNVKSIAHLEAARK